MKRLFPIIAVIILFALPGCTGQVASSDGKEIIFDRADPNLNGNMMDIVLSPTDARAGENITANLVVGNTGSEDINSESIEIKIKPISLNDFFANIAILLMSEGKKTLTFPNEYKESIKPGMIKPFTVVFPTPRELRGSNLAGTYDITVTLSVNGQAVESISQQLKLQSGKPRESSNAQNSTPAITATPNPTPTPTSTPTLTVTTAPTPTPAPTPQSVTVKPTGYIAKVTKIMGYKFGESTIKMNAGDTLQWNNLDDDTMILKEKDGKIPNQSVYWRTDYNFTTTGTYTFQLFYPKMRSAPLEQVITVVLNQSH